MNKIKEVEPLEDQEQELVVGWCEAQHIKIAAVPNGTYNPHASQQAKNYRTGLRPGFPDLIVLISPVQSKDGIGRMLMVEMKRRKTFKVSDEQKQWAMAINGLGIPQVESVIAHGHREAVDYLSAFLKRPLALK